MKKHLRLFGFGLFTVLGLVILTTGCTKDDNELIPVISEQEDQAMILTPDDTAKISFLVNELGFIEKDIYVTDESFVVEGDIVFDRTNFWELYNSKPEANPDLTAKRHYRSLFKVTSITTIPVYYDKTVNGTSWVTAIKDACTAWNSLGGRITLIPLLSTGYISATGINLKICTITGLLGIEAKDAIAEASFPTSSGYPGHNINISPNYSYLSPSTKKEVMAHEIGHCIGLMHTDKALQALLSLGSIITGISDSSTTDPNSVMASVAHSWGEGFTKADKEAFLSLYRK